MSDGLQRTEILPCTNGSAFNARSDGEDAKLLRVIATRQRECLLARRTTNEVKVILGAIMARYNQILRQIADDELEPIFWALATMHSLQWIGLKDFYRQS